MEYLGLILGLRLALSSGVRGRLNVVGDSQLVVRQVCGEWACNKPHLQQLCAEAKGLVAQLRQLPTAVTLEDVRREFNTEADLLSNNSMDRLVGFGVTASALDGCQPIDGRLPELLYCKSVRDVYVAK